MMGKRISARQLDIRPVFQGFVAPWLFSVCLALFLLAAPFQAVSAQSSSSTAEDLDKALLEAYQTSTKDPEKAREIATELFSAFESLGDKYGMATSMTVIAQSYSPSGNYEKELEYHEKALSYLDPDENPTTYTDALLNIATLHNNMTNFALAFEFQQKALSISERAGDASGTRHAKHLSASIFSNINDYDAAIAILAELIDGPEPDSLRLPWMYGTMAHAHREIGEPEAALDYLERGQSALGAEHADFDRMPLLLEFAIALNDLGRHQAAALKAQELFDMASKSDAKRLLCSAKIQLARAANAQGEPRQALAFMDHESCQNKDQTRADQRAYVVDLLSVKAEAYRSLGRNAELIEALQDLTELREAEYNLIRAQSYGVAQARLDAAESDGRIAFLEQQDKLQAVELQIRNLIILISLLAAIGLLVWGFRTYQGYKTQVGANGLLASEVSSQKSRVREAERDVAYKTLLLNEINHRVKNNFQIIISLMNLHQRKLGNSVTRATATMLTDITNRLQTMGIIQQTLDSFEGSEQIAAHEFVPELVSQLIETFASSVKVELDIDQITFDPRTAAPMALIINELVSNSVKHAFQDGKGTLCLAIKKQDDGCVTLTCSDDGPGFPLDFDLDGLDSFGLDIVQDLARKLDGNVTVVSQTSTIEVKLKSAASITHTR